MTAPGGTLMSVTSHPSAGPWKKKILISDKPSDRELTFGSYFTDFTVSFSAWVWNLVLSPILRWEMVENDARFSRTPGFSWSPWSYTFLCPSSKLQPSKGCLSVHLFGHSTSCRQLRTPEFQRKGLCPASSYFLGLFWVCFHGQVWRTGPRAQRSKAEDRNEWVEESGAR